MKLSFFLSFLVFLKLLVMAHNTKLSQVNIGLILDLQKPVGKTMLSYINMALSDFYETHSHFQTSLELHIRDSMDDEVAAAAAALDLIKNVEVQAILGPRTSMQAEFVIEIGEKTQVPILSFSASSPSLTYIRSPYFFRATQNDSYQVNAITAIVQAFGWREAVPIYIDNQFGQGIIPHLTDAFQSIGTDVPYRSSIPPAASEEEIEKELHKLMSMQTRVFIVHMSVSLTSKFFPKVKELGMMSEGYVWIVTYQTLNFLNWFAPSVVDSMEGVLGIRPYVSNSKKLKDFRVHWKRKENRGRFDAEELNIYGLHAYDAVTALAMAVEKSGTETASFHMKSMNYSTDLSNLGVSQNGPRIIKALSNTYFKGLTGYFYFVNGQLPSSAFEIVNIIGQGGRRIGFWTERNGLVRKLSSSSNDLGAIKWPGNPTFVPKGWEIPTNGRRLRIGVPMKSTKFVNVTRDPITKKTNVSGFCIDVFDAVVQTLPYTLSYDYFPSPGTYDDLVYQVHSKNFDAVVGDITIRGNRSSYVDFTLPYTESGVSMVVPLKDENHKNAWVFLKPLTWDLWVATFCFFLFIGFVVWVLEHRVNPDFRGPPLHQASTFFWFSFSTMVFAQRERVVSNLGRTITIIWCFVVLILSQSYTASLTSLLTVQKLQPTVTDVSELIKNKENVGYPKGSFVLGILEGMGFDKSILKMYNSSAQFHDLFSRGSKNGGISAAFEEVPYLKVFLADDCSKLTMVEPTFLTSGFGFVFPKGSPLVLDISRAILKVKEGDKMKEIQKKWFGKDKTCPDPSTSVSSNYSLSLQSFWGLFLIAGIASILALIVFVTVFLYQHRQVLMISRDPEASIWTKIVDLFKIFDQKDLSSHTFKKKDRNEIILSPRLSSYSVQTESQSPSAEESSPNQETPSPAMEVTLLDENQRGTDA